MVKLRIKNFGPIKEIYKDEYLIINKVSVFIGEQGSGKSTIAKLFSTLSWLEKDFFRTPQNVSNFGREELVQAIEYAKLRGVKTHLTLNILIKNNEFGYSILCKPKTQ